MTNMTTQDHIAVIVAVLRDRAETEFAECAVTHTKRI